MPLTPTKIIDKLWQKDEFSRWMGMERLEEGQGFCKLKMVVRPEMCNGMEIAHGGISYSFADSAFAFASNSQGRVAVSIETSISHFKALKPGDIIYAHAKEISLGKRTALYEVRVEREDGELVAHFKGTVFRKDEEWK